MRTLQLYVTRELAKTFALTAVGLTLTFSLCGSVLNMIQADVLTTMEMARSLWIVLPIALTFTLPVSALFACAMVYGRLAADNEFDACKASGINIHRLLAPAMGLSLVTAAITFTMANFVIPRFAERFQAMVQADIQNIAVRALNRQGYIRYGGYIIHAGEARMAKRDDGSDVVDIKDAAFLELKGEESADLERCGTARRIVIDFPTDPEGNDPTVSARMIDVRGIDIPHWEDLGGAGFTISKKLSFPVKRKPEFLNLPDLFYYREHPTELPEVRGGITKLRDLVLLNSLYRYVEMQLTGPEKVLDLEKRRDRGEAPSHYEIRARQVILHREEFHPELDDVVITHRQTGDDGKTSELRRYAAEKCTIKVDHDDLTNRYEFEIQLSDKNRVISWPPTWIGLFDLPRDLEADLDAGTVSAPLRKAFADWNVTLLPGATCSVTNTGTEWHIDNGGDRFKVTRVFQTLTVSGEKTEREHLLEDVVVPAEPLAWERSISDGELLGLDIAREKNIQSARRLRDELPDWGLGAQVQGHRLGAFKDVIELKREIIGHIHSRIAFSASVLVTLILAASLGIIYRGGQLLTAFVVALMPALVVVVMNITGRHLVEKDGTHLLGIVVIWAGIGLLAVADAVVLSRYLRR